MSSSISIEKLKSYIKTKGLVPTKIFTLDTKECVFIEIANPDTGSTIMLYIPSQYKLNYTESPSSINTKRYEIESVPSTSNSDASNINVSKLLQRFIPFVKKINYKITIMSSSFISYISRSNTVEFYRIKADANRSSALCETGAQLRCAEQPKSNTETIDVGDSSHIYNINIFVDLEQFYKKKTIWEDVSLIKKNIYEQFEENSKLYLINIKDIIDGTLYFKKIQDISLKKEEYNKNILEFTRLLDEICSFEKTIILQIKSIMDSYDNKTNNVTYDIEKTKEISKNELILSRINLPKTSIINCIIELISKLETIYIISEAVYFQIDKSISKIYKTLDNLNFCV